MRVCFGKINPKIPVKAVDEFNILGAKFKVKYINIHSHADWIGRLWDGNGADFNQVTQNYLRYSLAISVGDFAQLGVLQQDGFIGFRPWPRRRSQREVRCDRNVLLLTVCDQFLVVHVGVRFHL